MRRRFSVLKSALPWLLIYLATDIFFVVLLWLAAPESLVSISLALTLFTVLLIVVVIWLESRKQQKIQEAMDAFLEDPNEKNASRLLHLVDSAWHASLRLAATQILEAADQKRQQEAEMNQYREFMEAWTHEIKTPLSLATLVLANHREEMSPYVRTRMEYVRHEIASDVDRVLFYARLSASHVDYNFESINLKDFVEECLFDFKPLFEEEQVRVILRIPDLSVVCDRKVLSFMLSQLLSNARKYSKKEAREIEMEARTDEALQRVLFVIRDNGEGASSEDLPFLFDKGFTGGHPNRQNATGMGLYFVKKYADAMSIGVSVEEKSTKSGFGICLEFPIVRK
jgi:signal transduction histidine kinase